MDTQNRNSVLDVLASGHELENLLAQFRFMSSAGHKTSLNLSSEEGCISVSFNVELGFMSPPVGIPPPQSSSPFRKSPSYYRRLKRRRDARASIVTSTPSNTAKVFDVKEAEESYQIDSNAVNIETGDSLVDNAAAVNVLKMDMLEKEELTEERKELQVDNMSNIDLEFPGQIYKGNAVPLNVRHGNDEFKNNEEFQKPATALSQLASLTSRLNTLIAEPNRF